MSLGCLGTHIPLRMWTAWSWKGLRRESFSKLSWSWRGRNCAHFQASVFPKWERRLRGVVLCMRSALMGKAALAAVVQKLHVPFVILPQQSALWDPWVGGVSILVIEILIQWGTRSCLFVCFEGGGSYVAKATLTLSCSWEWPWTSDLRILALECWDYRHVPTHLLYVDLGFMHAEQAHCQLRPERVMWCLQRC